MTELLDDKMDIKPNDPKPNYYIGYTSLMIFLFLIFIQFRGYGTSETLLVQGSYFWLPFFVTGILSFVIKPKNAIILGVLTVPILYIFYQTIWHGL
ncbi:MAG: hypothetical protein MK207_15595 [Saprospiraceae bacterium]|nr:hypothetical protein [Saprospiraceae bacterium]